MGRRGGVTGQSGERRIPGRGNLYPYMPIAILRRRVASYTNACLWNDSLVFFLLFEYSILHETALEPPNRRLIVTWYVFESRLPCLGY
jgi:hypothetical protein